MKIYNRADIVNFMEIMEEDTPKLIRMQGFTEGGKSANSTTYDRRYIDERTERSDVTGYSPEIAYSFDRIQDNPIHDKICEITDDELVGEQVTIVTVNFNKKSSTGSAYEARKRVYSVIPDTDGDNTDAYTYSGTFHAAGDIIKGTATVSENGLTATFTADSEADMLQVQNLSKNIAKSNLTTNNIEEKNEK